MSKHHGFYEKLAEYYDFGYGRLLRHGQKMGVESLDLQPKAHLLEVGIGTGMTLKDHPKNIRITGIDLSENMLEQAQARVEELKLKNVILQKMSAEALEFKDGTFDAVFVPSVLSVVGKPKVAVEEMIRVCKRGGKICVISHFQGEQPFNKAWDKFFDPITNRFLGFRMLTPRSIIEKNAAVKILEKRPVYFLNFSTLYLLEKL